MKSRKGMTERLWLARIYRFISACTGKGFLDEEEVQPIISL
jgi:hypothetical protein